MKRAAAIIATLALILVPGTFAEEQRTGVGHHFNSELARSEVRPAVPAEVPMELLKANYSQRELEQGSYVGDEFCIGCHSWASITRDVKHRQALRTPLGINSLIDGKGVVADYDQNGVDDFMDGLNFNDISSVFDVYKPNAPILSYNAGEDTYWMTIGPLTVQVWITQGGTGDWKQRYLVRAAVSGPSPNGWTRDLYVSPLQYNEETDDYVAYHPEHWWDPDTKEPLLSDRPSRTDMATVGRSYSRRCVGCHTTGIRNLYEDFAGEWVYRPWPASLVDPSNAESYPDYDQDGLPDQVNIGCEACHGPGSAHILANGNADMILNPGDLETEGANEVCEQCHVRVKSVPTGKFGWPRDETAPDALKAWVPGVTAGPLSDFYTDSAGRWPDGKHPKQHHQQWHSLYESSKPTFQFHMIRCSECHSPHKGGEHMIVTSIEEDGVVIPTENDNNTLCLACHATHGPFEDITPEQVADLETYEDEIAEIVEAHSFHPYAPERRMGLSRCSKCHMPEIAKSAINYDIHSHTFEPIAPEKTLTYQDDGGMPNACAAACHSTKVNSFKLGMDPDIGVWNEPFDVQTAEELMYYFGPGGEWWDTDMVEGMTSRSVRTDLPPGRYVAPETNEEND